MTGAALQEQGYKRERIFKNQKQAKRYVSLRQQATEIFEIAGKIEVWKTPTHKKKQHPKFTNGLTGNFERKAYCEKNKIPYTKADNKTLNIAIETWLQNTEKDV